jgi:glutamate racemase
LTPTDGRPLGVFDSGVGGLSVVREIRRLSPHEDVVYVGDTANVPYGGRDPGEIRAFSVAITRFLVREAQCRAVVVACNTVTSAAVEALRAAFPVPIVGMEPGVKPAAAATHSGRVGVLATQRTLAGDRFAQLVERHADGVEVITQPCPGLVERIEAGDWEGEKTRALVEGYVAPLLAGGVDTLVLGCTHYPFLLPVIRDVAGPGVQVIDTGPAVARQVARVAPSEARGQGGVHCFTTDDPARSARAVYACFGDAVTLRRLRWREGELTDDATN